MKIDLSLDDAQLVATLVGARCYALQARLDRETTVDDGPERRHMREYMARLQALHKEIDTQIAAATRSN